MYINDVEIPFEDKAIEKPKEIEQAKSTFYIYANGQRIAKKENNKLYYFHNDHLGSPRVITDSEGNPIWQGDYLPFGEVFNEEGSNEIKYNSKELDLDTKLHYYGARYYLDDIGRFITADSVEVHPNAYVYTANNPLKFVDPSGNQYGSMGYSSWMEERGLPDDSEKIKSELRWGASFHLSLIPIVGTTKGFIETSTGKDLLTHQDLSTFEKIANIVGVLGSIFGTSKVISNFVSKVQATRFTKSLTTIEESMRDLGGFRRVGDQYRNMKSAGRIELSKKLSKWNYMGEYYGGEGKIVLKEFGKNKVHSGAPFHEAYHAMQEEAYGVWSRKIFSSGLTKPTFRAEFWGKKFWTEYGAWRVEGKILQKLGLPLDKGTKAALQGQNSFRKYFSKVYANN